MLHEEKAFNRIDVTIQTNEISGAPCTEWQCAAHQRIHAHPCALHCIVHETKSSPPLLVSKDSALDLFLMVCLPWLNSSCKQQCAYRLYKG